jgi:hypothetical protein
MLDLTMVCTCLHNMRIASSNGFVCVLWAQKNAQIETNTTFGDLKGVYIFKVVEEAIKQMKRL